MATSGTHNFWETNSSQFITDAYERIGILPDLISAQQIQSAQRSTNLLLSEWINRGLNLWTVKQDMLNLVPGENSYPLPLATSDVLEATIRTSFRRLGGTAFSSEGGIAQNAFDGNPLTACTQISPDGYISYNYGANNIVSVGIVGIQSNIDTTYTLSIDYSDNNVNWNTLLEIEESNYIKGVNVWYILPVPRLGQYFRVLESGGSTLDIQEIYFNVLLRDTTITRMSRSEYVALPNKNQLGRPTNYWVDRQVNPIMYIWPTPTPLYNNLYYTRVEMIQDIGQMTNMANIPQRFYEPLVAGLAAKLSLKFVPEKYEILTRDYKESYDLAARQDVEKVPLRIYGDYMQGWVTE